MKSYTGQTEVAWIW